MFCRHCNYPLPDQSLFCVKCANDPRTGVQYCADCGQPIIESDACVDGHVMEKVDVTAKSRWIAILLAFFLGWMGAHNFYLGNVARGVFQFVFTIVTLGVGVIWSWFEMFLLLTRNTNEDAKGVPLRD